MADTQQSMDAMAELNDLRMSEEAKPLYEHVKRFIAEETVEPMYASSSNALGEGRKDRHLVLCRRASSKCPRKRPRTKAKKQGLWNFFLPDAETGEGLSNLDYAYIAAELGKVPACIRNA
jgi:acyl-CoA dehydrogenase